MTIDLSHLPSLRDVVEINHLRAEKSSGKILFADQNITDKIVKAAGNLTAHHAIEIGPGLVALPDLLCNQAHLA